MLTIGDTIATRYTINQLLGQGGMGAVYLATDNGSSAPNQHVAIKVLRLGPDDSNLRFKREFRLMSRLQHRYILRVYSSGVHEELPYLVMEYLRGGTLESRFSQPVQDKNDLIERLRFVQEVSEALSYIHSQGIIHRDLKPDNVMLADNHARLMDFGLAKSHNDNAAQITQVGAVMGTATYMSPEQAKGVQVDARSDLYALGCLIYWLISHETPFSGNSFMEVLLQHLQKTPPSLLSLNALTPPPLAAIAEKLLAKSPAERYSAADDVSVEIANLIKSLASNHVTDASTQLTTIMQGHDNVTPAALLKPPMIGRKEELAQLQQGLSEPKRFVLESQEGLGVSNLLSELRRQAARQGHYSLFLRFNNDGGLPYAAWRSALAQLEKHHKGFFAEASKGLEEHLRPVMVHNLSVENATTIIEQHMPDDLARLRFYDAVDSLLTRYAALHPLLIIAEDIHLADEASIHLLSYMLRGKTAEQVSFVLGCAEGRLESALKQSLKSLDTDTITLHPFDNSTMQEYIAALLGGDIEPRLESYVKERAHGSPLFAKEILNGLLKAGHIKRRAGLWEWSRQHTRLPEGIDNVFGERIDALRRETQKALQAASTIGRHFNFDTLMELMDADEDMLLDAIDEALRAKLINESGMDAYTFVHPLLRDLLHSKLNPRRRRNYHQTLGDALATNNGDPDCIADHYAETKDPSQALPYALKVARRAVKVFANDIGETYYRLALKVMPDDYNDRAQVQLELGQLLDHIGKWDEAHNFYEDAQQTLEHKGVATYLLGTLARKRGELNTAENMLQTALILTPQNTHIHSELALIYGAQGQFDKAQTVLHLALALEIEGGNPEAIAGIQADLGKLEERKGNHSAAVEWFTEALIGIENLGDTTLKGKITCWQGLATHGQGKLAHAQQYLEQAYLISERTGDIKNLLKTLMSQGLVFRDLGDIPKAKIAYKKASIQAFRLGDMVNKALSDLNLGIILADERQYDEAITMMQTAEDYLSIANLQAEYLRAKAVLAETHIKNHDATQGLLKLAEANAIVHQTEEQEMKLMLGNFRAMGHIMLRNYQDARTILKNMLEQHNDADYKLILLDTYLSLASLNLLHYNHDEFTSCIRQSTTIATLIDDVLAQKQIQYLEAIVNKNIPLEKQLQEELLETSQYFFVKQVQRIQEDSLDKLE